MIIQIVLLDKKLSKLPTQNKEGDAGYDFYSITSGLIKHGERALVPTGIAMAIPIGYYGRIAPRSGLALKQGIDVMGGVVDSTYRGEIGVILLNTSGEDFSFAVGTKIAQIIIEKCHKIDFDVVGSLDETNRGEGGFGSSGV